MTVGKILMKKGAAVVSTSPDTLVSEAAKILVDKRIGLLVVVDGSGAIQGVVSERDIVRAVAQDPKRIAKKKVGQLLTKKVVACGPNSSPHDILETMKTQKFRHMPVVNQGKLMGIISISDVLKHLIDEAKIDRKSLEVLVGDGAHYL